ncbi:MAG: 23S rRNA (guanosine(2251)-2'-O)-methyltransferase RlmB [Deltaproteobacteria bacterium]|nr:23S rRNA (guanosine(2251)-2'-O)-methyltransferase RlmB [Deltaproteobacteria bacterium]
MAAPELLYGVHAVAETLRAGRRQVSGLWYHRQKRRPEIEAILGMAAAARIAVTVMELAHLTRLCHSPHHQGMVLRASAYPYTPFETLVSQAQAAGPPLLIVLDHVQDVGNFGAMIRLALCCGAHGLIVSRDHAVGVTPAVVRGAAGATEWLGIAQVVNVRNAITYLKNHHIWTVALEAGAATPVYAHDFRDGEAIVLGGEGKGVRRLVRDECDATLSIPQVGPLDSLNVTMAGAIVLGEVLRQRQPKTT